MGNGPLDFDWANLLNDTDEIRFRGSLRMVGAADSDLQVEALGINRDGLHSFDLHLARNSLTAPNSATDQAAVGGSAAECGERCSLSLRWRARPNRWSLQPSERHLEVAGTLAVLPAYLPWLNFPAGIEVEANGQWAQRGETGGGEFALQIRQEASAVAQTPARRPNRSGQHRGLHTAIIADAKLSNGDLGLELNPIIARSDGRRSGSLDP